MLGEAASGVKIRPDFNGKSLGLYLTGQQMADRGKVEEAAQKWQELGTTLAKADSELQVWLHVHVADMFSDHASWRNADAEYERAMVHVSKSHPRIAAEVFYSWAESFLLRSDWVNAQKRYEAALAEIGQVNSFGLAAGRYLNGLGTVALRRGDLVSAERIFRRQLAISDALSPDSSDIPLNNLGSIASSRGDFTAAQQYLGRSLAIAAKVTPNSMSFAKGLANFGALLLARGELDAAEGYYRRSLDIVNQIEPEGMGTAIVLQNLGSILSRRGELDAAESTLRTALEIKRNLAPATLSLATTLSTIAKVENQNGRIHDAEDHMREGLTIRARLAPGSLALADSLVGMAELRRNAGDLRGAETYYRQALDIRTRLAAGSVAQAENLGSLARVKHLEGDSTSAAALYGRAISAIEQQSVRLGASEDVRSEFRANHSTIYKDFIALLVAEGRRGLAFQILERSRAQVLLETLIAAQVDLEKGTPPLLIAQMRGLRDALSIKLEERTRLLTTKPLEEDVVRLGGEISDLLDQTSRLQQEMQRENRAYASLTEPSVIDTARIRRELLDRRTALLAYSLGASESHVFVITIEGIAVRTLPKRLVIENLARHVYHAMTERGRRTISETPTELAQRIGAADRNVERGASELSRMVLSPVREQIRDKRILLVSDGALQYVPFGALPDPDENDGHRASPMILAHEIVCLPSATVLTILRQHSTLRRRPAKTVAVIADPVFEGSDERVMTLHLRPTTNIEANASFRRLRFARQEASAILALVPHDRELAALDFDANRSMATNGELAEYRIVHFATHGLLDSVHPERSGLVLSMIDRAGRRQDGFLGLADVYNLNLPVELVVLSGCETGLGRDIQGEGLIGLTRGFMYAGAMRVVATLWNVNDLATAVLMETFYQAMLHNGKAPSAALRLAQLSMLKQPQWRAPYYWAAFQLHGDWR